MTVAPSGTVRSGPASTVGGELAGASEIVRFSESTEVALWMSVAVSVKGMVVLAGTSGAVNEGDRVAAVSAMVMLRAGSWDHR